MATEAGVATTAGVAEGLAAGVGVAEAAGSGAPKLAQILPNSGSQRANSASLEENVTIQNPPLGWGCNSWRQRNF